MKQQFEGWHVVARGLRDYASNQLAAAAGGAAVHLNAGQCATLRGIADRIEHNGVVIADEVGMGKTRIATTLARCVIAAGGRVAIVIPPGLGFQWQTELHASELEVPAVIRGLPSFYRAWDPSEELLASSAAARPWYDEPALLVSHAFSHWRLRQGTERTALLPELFARWRQRQGKYLPQRYDKNASANNRWGGRAAIGIVSAVPSDAQHAAHVFLDRLVDEQTWTGLHDSEAYLRNGILRGALERAVGLGLGMFDLVIIDEAHKGRNLDSKLSGLLSQVLLCAPHVRKVGLTATPVELCADQWWSTLARIDIGSDELGFALDDPANPIQRYACAVQRLRASWRSSASARAEYRDAAQQFQRALSPYLLRRDKREDPAVQAFARHTGLPIDRYRSLDEQIVVDPASLNLPWKRAICAAEALSVLSGQSDELGRKGKRLRLTIGNGHGIAAMLDHIKDDPDLDRAQHEYDGQPAAAEAPDDSGPNGDAKRRLRAQWWQDGIARAFAGDGDAVLFDHPAICAAVERIERASRENEKVLVFGRFTKPLQALVSLLNAREMLRRLRTGAAWPQTRVHDKQHAMDESSEWPAVRAAYRQLHGAELTAAGQREIDANLESQYRKFERERLRFREHLLDRLEQEFARPELQRPIPGLGRGAEIVGAFRSTVEQSEDGSELATVARALTGLLSDLALDGREQLPPGVLAQAFLDLVRSATSGDQPDSEDQAEEEHDRAASLWATVMARLSDEYNRPRGGFARLMNGNTKPESRRMIQLAFNRKDSFPQVLVAQSVVGREGLNLHEACRTVVLLHPEWNPGVVEQQIGRVDRVGSHWSQMLERAIRDGTPAPYVPRIEIHPVVFGGTYDAENWRVLQERWDDLRAQLHGVPVPSRIAGDDEEARLLIEEISSMAPDFSPGKRH